LYVFLNSPMRATRPARLILLDLIALIIFCEAYKFSARELKFRRFKLTMRMASDVTVFLLRHLTVKHSRPYQKTSSFNIHFTARIRKQLSNS
jgi:hypothetical protein